MSTERSARLAACLADLGPTIAVETAPALVRQKSRDFYWYSPILKQRLADVRADVVITPADEAELIRVLAACHAHDIPVTPRGGGTGNYGQCMPLAGGAVLDLTRLNAIGPVIGDVIRVGAGALIHDIDLAAAAAGQELRLYPSTWKTATIGGFVAGGAGGIGSVKWGGLRTPGTIRAVRVVTLEANPRVLTLTGDAIAPVAHAYGVNGIITEIEIALAPRVAWVEVMLGLETFAAAARLAESLGEAAGFAAAAAPLDLKTLGVWQAPIAHAYFNRHRRFLPETAHVVGTLVSPATLAHLLDRAATAGATVLFRSDRDGAAGLPPLAELAWNHTTLRALKVDPTLTYLQVLYPSVAAAIDAADRFADTCLAHLEFTRFAGKLTCLGVPLVRLEDAGAIEALIVAHEAAGLTVFNPHRYTLEEGGMKQPDPAQLAFKRAADPKGLLNPGKMIAWDRPDWDFRQNRTYVFEAAPAAAITR